MIIGSSLPASEQEDQLLRLHEGAGCIRSDDALHSASLLVRHDADRYSIKVYMSMDCVLVPRKLYS